MSKVGGVCSGADVAQVGNGLGVVVDGARIAHLTAFT